MPVHVEVGAGLAVVFDKVETTLTGGTEGGVSAGTAVVGARCTGIRIDIVKVSACGAGWRTGADGTVRMNSVAVDADIVGVEVESVDARKSSS